MEKIKPEFHLGGLATNSLRLLNDNWRRVLWIYVSIALVPRVLLGEMVDEPTDWLFPILGPLFNKFPEKIVTMFFSLPQWVFFGALTAALVPQHQKQGNSTMRSLSVCFTILILLYAYQYLFVTVIAGAPGAQIESGLVFVVLIFFAISLFFIFPAVAAVTQHPKRWPYELWRLTSGVRWKLLVIPLVLGLLAIISQETEEWFLKLLKIPDGTALDWATTFIQEIISSAYLILAVAVGVSAHDMLKRRQDGAPLAETAAVFD
jgi:hypothetical protein